MKKTLKILLISVLLVALFSIFQVVEANSIQKISMDIYVDNNGDAHITETWNCRTTEGTEVYHPYYNLGNSSIKDLTVSDGTMQYTTLSSWNTSGTLSSKAYKCGLNRITNGIEICWGISNYGSHTYEVKYTITNFVSELTDSQMIYWTLIPHEFSNTINDVYIKIHTDFHIEDTIDVWGYGNYGGTAYVYDGYIEMQPDGPLASNEYMTILVKFPLGTFNCSNKLYNDFNYYLDMAEEGAVKYEDTSTSSDVIAGIVFILFFMFYALIGGLAMGNSKVHFDYGPEGKQLFKKVEYFRDIPCNKDLFRAYYIGYRYGIVKNKTNLLGAVILKWLKDGLISIEQKETGLIFKKENTVVVLKQTYPQLIKDDKERKLFDMLMAASKDGYLENNEFEKWCKRCYQKMLNWFEDVIKVQENKLKKEGILLYEEKRALGIFKKKTLIATSELRKEAEEIAGLKYYLEDYSLIHEREAIEVHMFEEYLIYAQLMGIAKKVAKQFKDLYPEMIEQSSYNSYDNIIFIHTCSNNGIRQAKSAKSEAEARARSYSSGGGGFSSGGGGGGSFGGGGGGGGFR